MQKKVLVVDDEQDIVAALRITLELAGYEVITAANGREALKHVVFDKPDLVVMDVMMPGIDGLEALRRIKENEETAAIPVIILTAKDATPDMAKAWDTGADFYQTKPYSTPELVNLIHHILAPKTP